MLQEGFSLSQLEAGCPILFYTEGVLERSLGRVDQQLGRGWREQGNALCVLNYFVEVMIEMLVSVIISDSVYNDDIYSNVVVINVVDRYVQAVILSKVMFLTRMLLFSVMLPTVMMLLGMMLSLMNSTLMLKAML